MSYILEALRKSEQSRHGAVTLADAAAPVMPRRSLRRGAWAGGLLLMALVAWGGWWLGRSGAPVADVGTVPSGPGPSPAPIAETGNVAGSRVPAVVPVPRDRAVEEAPAPVPSAAVRLRPLPPVPTPSMPVPAVEAVPSTAAQPPPADDAPLWSELPGDQRRRVARPDIDVHVHAEDPARRFVLIGLKRYREGDRLPSGARLERIEPDGILLEDEGIRYRVPRP